MAHDALERLKIRGEALGAAGSPSARGEGVLLVGGLVAVLLAALIVPLAVLVAWLVALGILGLVVRQLR
jgi:hypothetical protein